MTLSFVLVSPQRRFSTSIANRRSSSALTAGSFCTLNLNRMLPSRKSMRSTSNARRACASRPFIASHRQSFVFARVRFKALVRRFAFVASRAHPFLHQRLHLFLHHLTLHLSLYLPSSFDDVIGSVPRASSAVSRSHRPLRSPRRAAHGPTQISNILAQLPRARHPARGGALRVVGIRVKARPHERPRGASVRRGRFSSAIFRRRARRIGRRRRMSTNVARFRPRGRARAAVRARIDRSRSQRRRRAHGARRARADVRRAR